MGMSAEAQTVMGALGQRFASAGFPSPWQWFFGVDDLGGTFEELAHLGLLALDGGAGSPCHLTDAGRSWILDHRGLVVVVQHGRVRPQGPLAGPRPVPCLRRRVD